MSKSLFIEQLKQLFKNQIYITRNELFDFYRTFDPQLKDSTFTWRIFYAYIK